MHLTTLILWPQLLAALPVDTTTLFKKQQEHQLACLVQLCRYLGADELECINAWRGSTAAGRTEATGEQ